MPKHNPFMHLSESTLARSTTASNVAALSIEELARFQPIIFLPGTFDIRLVLDIREVRTKTDRDYIGQKLTERGINVSKRVLEVGDILWVARLKDPSPLGPDEIVLDYIVERKRMDDLVYSIKDGRFNEQKVTGRKKCTARRVTAKSDETHLSASPLVSPEAIRAREYYIPRRDLQSGGDL